MIAYLQSTKAPHNPQPWISSLPHSRGDQAFEEQEEWVQSCGLTGWFACCCCCYCCLLWVPTSSRKSRAHTHTLSILLRLSSSSWVFVLCSSPTRESEGPNRPLQQPYKSIRRTQPSSPAALHEYPKDPTVLYNRPTRESEGPLLSTCSSPTGNPKEPCIVCSSPTGSLKNFVHPSTTALQRES
jgi:hypothetical protein